MKIETQGYGSSMVATKYVYERINDIVDYQNKEQSYSLILVHLKELQEELLSSAISNCIKIDKSNNINLNLD